MGNLQGGAGLLEQRDRWLFVMRNHKEFESNMHTLDADLRSMTISQRLYSSRCHVAFLGIDSGESHVVVALPRADIFACPVLSLSATTPITPVEPSNAINNVTPDDSTVQHGAASMITLGCLFLGMRTENEGGIFNAIERRFDVYLNQCANRLGHRLLSPFCIPYKTLAKCAHSLVLARLHAGRDLESYIRTSDDLHRLSYHQKMWILFLLALALNQAAAVGCPIDWLTPIDVNLSDSASAVVLSGFGASSGLLNHLVRQQASISWDILFARSCTLATDHVQILSGNRVSTKTDSANSDLTFYKFIDCSLPPEVFPDINILAAGPSALLNVPKHNDGGVFSFGCLAARLLSAFPSTHFLTLTEVLDLQNLLGSKNPQQFQYPPDFLPSRALTIYKNCVTAHSEFQNLIDGTLQPHYSNRVSLRQVLETLIEMMPEAYGRTLFPYLMISFHPAFNLLAVKGRILFCAVLYELSILNKEAIFDHFSLRFRSWCANNPIDPTVIMDNWEQITRQKRIVARLRAAMSIWSSANPPETWDWSQGCKVKQDLLDFLDVVSTTVENFPDDSSKTSSELEDDLLSFAAVTELAVWRRLWESNVYSDSLVSQELLVTEPKVSDLATDLKIFACVTRTPTTSPADPKLDVAIIMLINLINEFEKIKTSSTDEEFIDRFVINLIAFLTLHSSALTLTEVVAPFCVRKKYFLPALCCAHVLTKTLDNNAKQPFAKSIINLLSQERMSSNKIISLPMFLNVMHLVNYPTSQINEFLAISVNDICLNDSIEYLRILSDVLPYLFPTIDEIYRSRLAPDICGLITQLSTERIHQSRVALLIRCLEVSESCANTQNSGGVELIEFYSVHIVRCLKHALQAYPNIQAHIYSLIMIILEKGLSVLRDVTPDILLFVGECLAFFQHNLRSCGPSGFSKTIIEHNLEIIEKVFPVSHLDVLAAFVMVLAGRALKVDGESKNLRQIFKRIRSEGLENKLESFVSLLANRKTANDIIRSHCWNLCAPAVSESRFFAGSNSAQIINDTSTQDGLSAVRNEATAIRMKNVSINLPVVPVPQTDSPTTNIGVSQNQTAIKAIAWINTIYLQNFFPNHFIMANTCHQVGLIVLNNDQLVVTLRKDQRLHLALLYDCSDVNLVTPPPLIQKITLDAQSITSIEGGRLLVGLTTGEITSLATTQGNPQSWTLAEPPLVSTLAGPFASETIAPVFVHSFHQRANLVIVTTGGLTRRVGLASGEELFSTIPTKFGPILKGVAVGKNYFCVLTAFDVVLLFDANLMTIEGVIYSDEAQITDVGYLPPPVRAAPTAGLPASPIAVTTEVSPKHDLTNILVVGAVSHIDNHWWPYAVLFDCREKRTRAILRSKSSRVALGDVRGCPQNGADLTYVPQLEWAPDLQKWTTPARAVAARPIVSLNVAPTQILLTNSRGGSSHWRWTSQDWLRQEEAETLDAESATVVTTATPPGANFSIRVVDNWRDSTGLNTEGFFGQSVFLGSNRVAVVNLQTLTIELHQ